MTEMIGYECPACGATFRYADYTEDWQALDAAADHVRTTHNTTNDVAPLHDPDTDT